MHVYVYRNLENITNYSMFFSFAILLFCLFITPFNEKFSIIKNLKNEIIIDRYDNDYFPDFLVENIFTFNIKNCSINTYYEKTKETDLIKLILLELCDSKIKFGDEILDNITVSVKSFFTNFDIQYYNNWQYSVWPLIVRKASENQVIIEIMVINNLLMSFLLVLLIATISDFQNEKAKTKINLDSILVTNICKNTLKDRCCICLNSITKGNKISTLPCFHIYHYKCIEEWFQIKIQCPLCRR